MPSIVAFSTCVMDEFPEQRVFAPGGNALNFALGARRAGWTDVSMIAAVGNDEAGRAIIDLLLSRGVATDRISIRPGATASNKLFLNAAGERFARAEDWRGGVYEDFLLSEDDWQFAFSRDVIATAGNNPNFPELMRRRASVPQPFVVVDFLDDPSPERVKAALPQVDIAFMACESGSPRRYSALDPDKLVVATLGAGGSVAFFRGETVYQQALHVDRVIDTTGCGDAFQSAFACSWFERRELRTALRAGAEAGRSATQQIGGAF